MSLNCPHAWEEYKKLDSAYDDLRREYFALRGEQSSDNPNEFKNVSKEWLEKMRELRVRCLGVKDIFHNIEEKYNFITLKRAEKIMGAQFYGPQEIKNAFGFKVDIEKIPAIPYSPAELEKAKELGERLVLRISEDEKGKAMTMEYLGKIAQARMAKDEGKLLQPHLFGNWYNDEDFFNNNSLRTEWKLVGGNLLENSTRKTYAEQTKILRDYLKMVGSLTATEENQCSDDKLEKISMSVKRLSELEINQKHRRSPGEVLYDWFLHFRKFKDRDYLEKRYDWTNIVCSKGLLVNIGNFDINGALVMEQGSVICRSDFGVVSVR